MQVWLGIPCVAGTRKHSVYCRRKENTCLTHTDFNAGPIVIVKVNDSRSLAHFRILSQYTPLSGRAEIQMGWADGPVQF